MEHMIDIVFLVVHDCNSNLEPWVDRENTRKDLSKYKIINVFNFMFMQFTFKIAE